MWLGGNDIKAAGVYIWESSGKQVTYTNWSPSMPDDFYGPQSENCMHMWQGHGQWNDLRCVTPSQPQSTMCEKLVSCNEFYFS